MPWLRPALALAMAVALVPSGPLAPATASVSPRPPVGAPSGTSVTLITGDRVVVEPDRTDMPYRLEPAPRADGSVPGFRTTRDGEALYVIPADVAPYVGTVLDRALFDVAGLVAMGYDDRSVDVLPVVVQTNGPVPSGSAIAVDRAFDRAGLAAGRLDRGSAATLLGDLADGRLSGVERVWLDRRVIVAPVSAAGSTGEQLDHNLRQIEAPAAWDAGLSGAGVRVAVLDSGVDADHPDLDGQVAASVNLTESPSGDALGTGTHSAALIAGTGAAAEGARRGVAYGAELLSAKVVGDDGFGQESWVLAGLDWAVEQGADVISIGVNGFPGPATDPVTLAIDALVEDTGATVVVPTGDVFFPEPFTISAPGGARHALTVGAVTPDDTLSLLSGRGPTYEYRLKPDLLAPGEQIVSAVPGDDRYATRDATAAAAAHAAGAAALVLEQHPTWRTEQVRAALVGNAHDLDGLARDEQGGGRLDVGAAVAEDVVATPPVLDFGLLPYPQLDPDRQSLTITNDGEADVRVRLSLELFGPGGEPAPGGLAALDDTSLALPADGQARTTLTVAPLDLADAPPGRYEGAVRVTGPGGTMITVPVGLYREPERYDLTVRVLDRAGDPFTAGGAEIFNKESFTRGFFPYEELGPDGAVTVRVEPGWYSATARVNSSDGTTAITAVPETHVTGDTEVVLDARAALPITAELEDRAADLVESHVHYSIADEEGRSNYYSIFPDPAEVEVGRMLVTPTAEGTQGAFHLVTRFALQTPADGDHPAEIFEVVYQDTAVPDPPTYVHDPDDLASVERLDETYKAVGAPDVLRSYRAYASDVVIVGVGQFRPLPVPSRRVEHVLATPGVFWLACVYPNDTAPTQVCGRDGAARAGKLTRHRWLDVVHPNPGLLQRWDATTLFTQMGLGDGAHKGLSAFEPWASTVLSLYDADGDLVDREESDFAYFPVEPGPGTYTLEQVAELQPGHGTTVTSATTRWTFSTEEPAEPAFDLPGFLDVGYRPGTDELGRAEPGRGLRLGLRVPPGNGVERAPITSARAWVSVDGGTAWTELALREPEGGLERFVTRVPRRVVPTGTGALALRVEITDAAGRTLEQTLVDAIMVG